MMEKNSVQDLLKDHLYKDSLIRFLYHVADDELIMGHRDSEWLGVAPEIEEDIAFSSIAQDEVGHATYFYSLLEELGEGEADTLAYERKASLRKNAVFVELENGDWAQTVLRHFLYDVFEDVRLDSMVHSSYPAIAFGARKMKREEHYHLLHMETLVRRLGIAGGEARKRLQNAFSVLWDHVGDLFAFAKEDCHRFTEYGILTEDISELQDKWTTRVEAILKESLIIDDLSELVVSGGTRFLHTEALEELVGTLGEVHELNRAASW